MQFYEVRDVDGTSFTGVSQLVGYYRYRPTAVKQAEAVEKRDSWHSGIVIPHTLNEEEED